MIFFPSPYPDELLYSVVARYHFLTRNDYVNKSLNQMFGSQCNSLSHELTGGINSLIRRIPGKNNNLLWDLVLNHTLFAYYSSFISNKSRVHLMKHLTKQDTSQLTPLSSIISSRRYVKRQILKFCPACILDDIKMVGEPYWHMTHQPGSVKLCLIHGYELCDKCGSCGRLMTPKRDELLLCSRYCLCGNDLTQAKVYLNRDRLQIYETLARNTLLLMVELKNPLQWLDYKQLFLERYLTAFKSEANGYKKLQTELENRYGEELLYYLWNDLDVPTIWLYRIVNQPEKPVDPLFLHILLYLFMGLIDSTIPTRKLAA